MSMAGIVRRLNIGEALRSSANVARQYAQCIIIVTQRHYLVRQAASASALK